LKKTLSIILGILIGLFSSLYLTELFKGLTALILKGEKITIIFEGLLITSISQGETNNFLIDFIAFVSPLIAVLILLEISLYAMTKTSKDSFRMIYLISQIVLIGFFLLNIITGVAAVLLKNSSYSGWYLLLDSAGYTHNQKLIFMFFILLISFAYLNFISKRIRRYTPMIHQNKPH
jgi:hypothetical protein